MAMIMSKTMFPVRSAPIMPISLAVLSMLLSAARAMYPVTTSLQRTSELTGSVRSWTRLRNSGHT